MSFAVIAPIMLLCIIAIPAIIGVYVYRDADQRGMNAVLWTIVSVFAPGFTGFIIYLIVRTGYSDLQCPTCGMTVKEQYTVCPNCGTKLKSTCQNCQLPVEPEWTVCPRCAQPLTEWRDDVMPPVRKKDRSLFKIMLIIVIVPIVLLLVCTIGLISYRTVGYSHVSSVLTAEYDIDEFAGNVVVQDWIKQWDNNPDQVQGIQFYPQRMKNENRIAYLIYYPGGIDEFNASSKFMQNSIDLSISSDNDYDDRELVYIEVETENVSSLSWHVNVNGKTTAFVWTAVDYDPIESFG